MTIAFTFAFILLTTAFTVFICIMFFALLGAIQEVMKGVNMIAEMNCLILKNGFEIEYLPPNTVRQQQEKTEQVDNTGKITSTSEIVDGVLRVYVSENYLNLEGESTN